MTLFGEVTRTESLAPRMRRVVLGGPGLAGFETTSFTDQYVNALFLPPDSPWEPPFSWDDAKAAPPEDRPRGRRYTVRRWDVDAREVTIDFVTHGDVGLGGAWADAATEGDRLQIVGPSGGYAPRPDAPWHLFIGDESAYPAIAASLEQLPPAAIAIAVIEVDGPGHELPLESLADVAVHFVHRSADLERDDVLETTVRDLEFPAGEPQVFLHGEAAAVRSIRRHLIADRGVDKEGQSISPYWRRNHTDEEWRAIKREWVLASEHEA